MGDVAENDKYYMNSAEFAQAEQDSAAAVKTFNETVEKIITELKGYTGEDKWEGGKANAKFTSEMTSAETKLKTIGENIKTNKKVFTAIKGFVSQYDSDVSAKVDTMVE